MKYTFKTFIAAQKSKNFDLVELDKLMWAEKFLYVVNEIIYKEHIHDGGGCAFCMLEDLLHKYTEYCFDEEGYRREHDNIEGVK